jgi:hypothetical protein
MLGFIAAFNSPRNRLRKCFDLERTNSFIVPGKQHPHEAPVEVDERVIAPGLKRREAGADCLTPAREVGRLRKLFTDRFAA